MSGNSHGVMFKFTTFGESHGEAIGCVVDGVPSKIFLSEQDIQRFLDKRRTGQNR
ncbi:MAG: chorismate synthase, partial [Alphaproteobacteria bacterium]|nr:chorismate synthase [Alphaproteobacteria bacterium]